MEFWAHFWAGYPALAVNLRKSVILDHKGHQDIALILFKSLVVSTITLKKKGMDC